MLVYPPPQIRAALDNLPDGLSETYQRILMSINKVPAKARFAGKTFRWLICARRPLLIEELQEAVAFGASDTRWDAEKIPDADLLLQSCHSLAVRDRTDATVRFAHHTVQQYLTQPGYHWPSKMAYQDYGSVKFPEDAIERDAAILCITYLNFSDFETAMVPRTSYLQFQRNGILGPGGPGTIPSTLGIGKPVIDIMYRMLGGRGTANYL